MKKVFASGALALTMLAAAMTAAPLSTALAADPAKDAVQARRGYFRMLALNFGPLVGMAKGEKEYNAGAATTHSANLALLGQMDIAHLFPTGTDKDSMAGETRALAKIWQDSADVAKKIEALKTATAAMAEAAPKGLDALKGAVPAVGGACKGCHDTYRAEDF